MSFEKTGKQAAFKAALKTLDEAPKRIKAARDVYSQTKAELNSAQNKRIYSELFRENAEKDARAERDAVIRKQVDSIRNALDTVRAERDFSGASLDISDPKLQNALNVCNSMKKLSPATQMSIIESFRGDVASLRFIADLFESRGMYYADYARSLTAPIPQAAIDDMQYCCDRFDYCGVWDNDSDGKIYWTRGEFGKALERYGYADNDSDPYEDALSLIRSQNRDDPATLRATANAIQEMRNRPDMSDAERAEVFNRATEDIKTMQTARDEQQTKMDAALYKADQKIQSMT